MGGAESHRLEERLAYELLLIVGMALLALVQTTLLSTPFGFPPALLLVFLVCWVLIEVPQSQRKTVAILRAAFYGGIALDLMSTTPVGSHALALLIVVTLVFTAVRKLHFESPFLSLAAVFLSGVVYEIILALVYTSTFAMFSWTVYLIAILLPSVLLTLVPTLPVFFLLRWLADFKRGAISQKNGFAKG